MHNCRNIAFNKTKKKNAVEYIFFQHYASRLILPLHRQSQAFLVLLFYMYRRGREEEGTSKLLAYYKTEFKLRDFWNDFCI